MVTLRSPNWISITVVHRMVLGFSIASLMVFSMVGGGGASTNIHTPHDQWQDMRKQHEAEAEEVPNGYQEKVSYSEDG